MRYLLCVLFIAGTLTSFPSFAQPKTGLPALESASNAPAVSCKALEAFEAKMHAAIRAALKYPAKVLYHGTYGITTIEYDYLNGHVTNIHVITSSGDGVLDRAAVAAVKDADYSSILPVITGRLIHDMVFIVFDNTGVLSRNIPNRGGKDAKTHAQTNCVAG